MLGHGVDEAFAGGAAAPGIVDDRAFAALDLLDGRFKIGQGFDGDYEGAMLIDLDEIAGRDDDTDR